MESKISKQEAEKRRAQIKRHTRTTKKTEMEPVFGKLEVQTNNDDITQQMQRLFGPARNAENYLKDNEKNFLGADLGGKSSGHHTQKGLTLTEIIKPIFGVLSFRNHAPLFNKHPAEISVNVAPLSPYQPSIYSSHEKPKPRQRQSRPKQKFVPSSDQSKVPENNLDESTHDGFSDNESNGRWGRGLERWMEPQMENTMSPAETTFSAQPSNYKENNSGKPVSAKPWKPGVVKPSKMTSKVSKHPGHVTDSSTDWSRHLTTKPYDDASTSSTDSDTGSTVKYPTRPPKKIPKRPKTSRREKERSSTPDYASHVKGGFPSAFRDSNVKPLEPNSFEITDYSPANTPGRQISRGNRNSQPKIVDKIRKRKMSHESREKAKKKPRVIIEKPVDVALQEKFLPLMITVAIRSDCPFAASASRNEKKKKPNLQMFSRNRQKSRAEKTAEKAAKHHSIVSQSKQQDSAANSTDIIKRATTVEVCPASTSSTKQSDDKRHPQYSIQQPANHKAASSPPYSSPCQLRGKGSRRHRDGSKDRVSVLKKRPSSHNHHGSSKGGKTEGQFEDQHQPPRSKKKKYNNVQNNEEKVSISTTDSFTKEMHLQNGFEEESETVISNWQQQQQQEFSDGQRSGESRADYNIEKVISIYDSARFINDAKTLKHRADDLQKVLAEMGKQGKRTDPSKVLKMEVERVWTYFNASLKYSIGGYKMDLGEEGYEKHESKNTLSIYKSTIQILIFVKDSIKKIQNKPLNSKLKNQLNRLYVFCLMAISVLSNHVYKIQKDLGNQLKKKINNIMNTAKSNAGHLNSGQLDQEKAVDSPSVLPMLPQSSPMLNQPGPSPAAGSTCSSNTSEHVSSSTQIKTGVLMVTEKLLKYISDKEEIHKHLLTAYDTWQEATDLKFSDHEFFLDFNRKVGKEDFSMFSSVKEMYIHMKRFTEIHQPQNWSQNLPARR